MELSISVKEILIQAHMFMKETESSTLCVEHILYGVLMLADYLEPPFNEDSYAKVGKAVRNMVEDKFISVASAREHLKKAGKDEHRSFVDAKETLAQAAKLAYGKEIGAKELTQAVLESSTPVMEKLKKVKFNWLDDKDARYHPKSSEPEKKKKMNVFDKKINVRYRTKMGPFTYHGGKVAAIIQYFLFGILVPAILPAALQLATGFLQQPHAPWLSFICMVYVSLWVFYLGRGMSLVLGMISNAFGNFLDIMLDIGLIAALVHAVSLAWGLQEVPLWLRIVSCLAALLVQIVGTALYEYLGDKDDKLKTRIFFNHEEGTPDKIFFHTLSKMLYLPLFGLSIWWIWKIKLPVWTIKALWIAAFVMVFYIIWVAFICNGLRYEKSSRRRKGARLAKFLVQFHLFMFIPELVVVLHWVFGWFPMKLWVIIILSIYTLFFLYTSIGVARMKSY